MEPTRILKSRAAWWGGKDDTPVVIASTRNEWPIQVLDDRLDPPKPANSPPV